MNIETLQSLQTPRSAHTIHIPLVTKENKAQIEEWLKKTEELGIGFGKYF